MKNWTILYVLFFWLRFLKQSSKAQCPDNLRKSNKIKPTRKKQKSDPSNNWMVLMSFYYCFNVNDMSKFESIIRLPFVVIQTGSNIKPLCRVMQRGPYQYLSLKQDQSGASRMAIQSHIHIIFTLIDVCKGKNRPYIQTSTSVGNMENSRVT